MHPTTVLTDSKPCVQAIDKLCRGEFSASPRVTFFLTTISRYQVGLQYLAGKGNLPSDFTSSNAPDCNGPNCQIDGVLVVKRSLLFVPVIEAIIVPRSVLDCLLTALHIKLNHPSRHQFQIVLQSQFFALDMNDAISRVTSACHTCASLLSFPPSLVSQSFDDPPEVVGVSFAADVIKRHRQSILVLRECTTSFTASCLIPDERHDTLRDALTRLIIGLHPLDGPSAIVRVDPATGFASMSSNDSLKHLNVTIEVGRVKNRKKNPVAEEAVRELEEELIRQEPGGRPVSEVGLAIATARLNSRLRFCGLSSRELWTQRNQFTHEQLPLSDSQFILAKHDLRSSNNFFSEKSKNPRGLVPNSPPLQTGDLVYLVSDKDKSRDRDRYIVVSTDPPWCFVKKLGGSQLRTSSYKVKLSECFPVPPSVVVSNHPGPPVYQDKDEEPLTVTPAAPSVPVQPTLFPPAPPELTTVPSDDEQSPPLASADTTLDVPFHIPSPAVIPEEPCTNVVATDQSSSSSPCSSPEPPDSRPQRQRKHPSYLNDYVRF